MHQTNRVYIYQKYISCVFFIILGGGKRIWEATMCKGAASPWNAVVENGAKYVKFLQRSSRRSHRKTYYIIFEHNTWKTKNTPLCYAHYKLCALSFVYWIIRLVFVSYNFEMKALLTKERLSKLREWDLKSLILTIYRIVVYKGPLLTYISVQKQEVFKRLTHHYQEKPGFLYIYLDTWSFK